MPWTPLRPPVSLPILAALNETICIQDLPGSQHDHPTTMTAAQIRKSFVRYFESLDHRVVPSSSLVPRDDPTILFANAGMNQFKRVFQGAEKPLSARAVSVQKCIRAGG